jgi:uncharacterized membrane protein
VEPFVWLSSNVSLLNAVSYVLFGLGCVGVLGARPVRARRPRLAQLCFLIVALFLLTSKVWSQQFVLWLIPLVVLARPAGARSWPGRRPRSATSSPSTPTCSTSTASS